MFACYLTGIGFAQYAIIVAYGIWLDGIYTCRFPVVYYCISMRKFKKIMPHDSVFKTKPLMGFEPMIC